MRCKRTCCNGSHRTLALQAAHRTVRPDRPASGAAMLLPSIVFLAPMTLLPVMVALATFHRTQRAAGGFSRRRARPRRTNFAALRRSEDSAHAIRDGTRNDASAASSNLSSKKSVLHPQTHVVRCSTGVPLRAIIDCRSGGPGRFRCGRLPPTAADL